MRQRFVCVWNACTLRQHYLAATNPGCRDGRGSPSAASQILLDRTGVGNPEKCRRRKDLSQLDFLTHGSRPQSFRSGPPRRLEDLPAGCVRPFPTVGNLNISLDFQDWGLWTGLRRATLLHAYPDPERFRDRRHGPGTVSPGFDRPAAFKGSLTGVISL